MSSNRVYISTAAARTRLTIALVAVLACASCRHPHDPRQRDAGELLDGGAELTLGRSRACAADAASCDEAACSSDADCAPVTCQRMQCLDARCVQTPVPAGSACGAGQVCSQTGSCGDCVPGTQRCQPGSAISLETCSEAGQWRTSRCEGQACFNGQCTGECEPGSAICEGALQRRCGPDGRFGATQACAAGSCQGGACQAECAPGSARCLDRERMQTCSAAGAWGAIEPCPGAGCDAQRGRCETACTPGQTQCLDDGAQRTCGADGTWQAAVACALGCVAQRCAVCRTGELRCQDGAVEACSAGSWQRQEPCAAGCQAGHCNACVPETAECPDPVDRTQIRFCRPDGTWRPVEGCRPHARCVGGAGNTCPCDPGYQASGLDGDPAAGSCEPI